MTRVAAPVIGHPAVTAVVSVIAGQAAVIVVASAIGIVRMIAADPAATAALRETERASAIVAPRVIAPASVVTAIGRIVRALAAAAVVIAEPAAAARASRLNPSP